MLGFANGCSFTISESNSPNMAMVGPGLPHKRSALIPVIASPALNGIPRFPSFSETNLAVLISLKPGSGLLRIVLVILMISSDRESISSNAMRFNSSEEAIFPP